MRARARSSGLVREMWLIQELRELGCWIETSEELDRMQKVDFAVVEIDRQRLDLDLLVQVTFRDHAIGKASEFFSIAEERAEGIYVYIETPNMSSARLTRLVKRVLADAYRDALRLNEPYFWVKIRRDGTWHRWNGLDNIKAHLADLRQELDLPTNHGRRLGWIVSLRERALTIADAWESGMRYPIQWRDVSPDLTQKLLELMERGDISWKRPGQRIPVRLTPIRYVAPNVHYIGADVTESVLPESRGWIIETQGDACLIQTDEGTRYLAWHRDMDPRLLARIKRRRKTVFEAHQIDVHFHLMERPRHPTTATEVTLIP